MEFKKRINADVASSVAQLQAVMKQFLLRQKLYRILLRGKGLEFEAYRTYAQDDDARAIDWKASKRSNSLLVKQYRDEKNLKIVFIVDVGNNMVFGSQEKLKCEYAAEVVGALAHLIIHTGDRAGVAFFSDEIKGYIKPSGGDKHFHRLIDKLTDATTYGKTSNLRVGFDFAIDYLSRNIDSVVIVSDFINFDRTMIKPLSTVAAKFETVVLMIRDPLDDKMPPVSSEFVVEDPKTGQQLLINPKVAGRAYEKFSAMQKELVKEVSANHNIDFLELNTRDSIIPGLPEFLQGRANKKRIL